MTDADKAQDSELIRSAAAGGSLAQLILELWQRTRTDWSFASDRLQGAFRRRKHLGSAERRFVAETLYGMIRHSRRLDEALTAGGLRAVSSAPDRERLLAYLVLEAGLDPAAAAAQNSRVDWKAVAAIDERLSRESRPSRRLALRYSLGEALAEALVADHGDAAEALAEALNQRAPMSVRANTLVASRDELFAALAAEGIESEPGRYSETAVIVRSRTNLFSLAAFKKGMFEAQDEGSQLIAEAVAPPPGSRVVDFCAGAGGKTLALAAAMTNKGRIIATDTDARKLSELKRRARRGKVDTVQTVQISGDSRESFPPAVDRLVGRCPRVLVDAPCTGIGALRRNPEARYRITPGEIDRLTELQHSIVDRALSLVQPGGRLVYATCSVLHRENRGVVDRLVSERQDLEVVPLKVVWGRQRAEPVTDPSGTYLELFPHVHGTDGFFAAVLRLRQPG